MRWSRKLAIPSKNHPLPFAVEARSDGVVILALQRAKKRNGFSSALIANLSAAFQTWVYAESLEAVVLESSPKEPFFYRHRELPDLGKCRLIAVLLPK